MNEKHGTEEGDICRRDGCKGSIEFETPDNCSCHINPPCSACVEVKLNCTLCGWREDEES